MSSLVLLALCIAGSAGQLIRCAPCHSPGRCDTVPPGCPERVREPGCGCCVTCALREGQPCGVYSSRCATGLVCRELPGENKPLQALLEGRGRCVRKEPDTAEEHAEYRTQQDVSVTASSVTPITTTNKPRRTGMRPPHHPKSEVLWREQGKRSHSFRVELSTGAILIDRHNFSQYSKREEDYGPCRREMEYVLNTLKLTDSLSPRRVHIPNCDKKGYYKKRQCRPAKGKRRGICWCVDKYGQSLPSYGASDGGTIQCHSLDNK